MPELKAVIESHSLAVSLTKDGKVWYWSIPYPQFTKDKEIVKNIKSAVPYKGIDGMVQLAGGEEHFLALNLNGTLYSWCGNTFGQLGRETTFSNQDFPAKVDLPPIAKIGAGVFRVLLF